jgi:biotin carboxyl carrier protein
MRSIRFWTNTLTALALLSSALLCAQEAAVPSRQAAPATPQVPAPNAQGAAAPAAEGSAVGQEQSKTVLFEGTPVRLRLTGEVSSANAQVGDAVNFDTLEDVRLGDVVVIPKGFGLILGW